MPPSRIELLQRMPIFGALREDSLLLLLQTARASAVGRGEFFFREGDAADSMFVLESGAATVIKGWQGQQFVLRELVAGDCFGEMALMDLMPRSAAVRSLADCRAIELTAAGLLQLYEHDVEQFALIQMNLGREVCRRLRATDEMLFRARLGDVGAAAPALVRVA